MEASMDSLVRPRLLIGRRRPEAGIDHFRSGIRRRRDAQSLLQLIRITFGIPTHSVGVAVADTENSSSPRRLCKRDFAVFAQGTSVASNLDVTARVFGDLRRRLHASRPGNPSFALRFGDVRVLVQFRLVAAFDRRRDGPDADDAQTDLDEQQRGAPGQRDFEREQRDSPATTRSRFLRSGWHAHVLFHAGDALFDYTAERVGRIARCVSSGPHPGSPCHSWTAIPGRPFSCSAGTTTDRSG